MAAKLLIILLLLTSSFARAQNTITLYFDFNSSSLTNESRNMLDEFMNSKFISGLGIFGHTDQMGAKEYNDSLSFQRARTVRDYLLSRGVERNKIGVVRGFGTDRLITELTDEDARRLNRRVVITNQYKATAMDSAVAVKQSFLYDKPGSVIAKQPAATSEATERGTPTAPVVKKEEPVVKQQKNEKLIEDIKDKSTKAGENIVLKNINFYAGSHSFLASATPALEDLLEAMQKIPTLEIEIQGHVCCQMGETDAIDNATGEMTLSVNRAKAVYDYLVEKGISKNRLSYKGLAHQYPLVKVETTEEDRIANRRVEIKILKK